MPDLEIRGAEEFARVAARVRAVGDKELRKELYAGLNRAAKPAVAAIKPNVVAKLPHRGGAGQFIASGLRTNVRGRGGANPSVKILSKSGHNISALDAGRLNHPVFGTRGVWRSQAVEPNIFTEPIEERAPEIRQEMLKTIRDVARKIDRSAS
jgi:hypothetical protein